MELKEEVLRQVTNPEIAKRANDLAHTDPSNASYCAAGSPGRKSRGHQMAKVPIGTKCREIETR